MPRTYQGRRRSTSHGTRIPKPKTAGNKARSYVIKLLKQSGWVLAALLLFYIIKYGNPNFYSYISPQIRSALNYNIDVTPYVERVNTFFTKPDSNSPENTDESVPAYSEAQTEPEENNTTPDTEENTPENTDNAENGTDTPNDLSAPANGNDDSIVINM